MSHLYFGKAAAENEVKDDPVRFRETYMDKYDLPKRVLNHESFLILGPKGSGKSAAGYFVAESWKHQLGHAHVFAHSVDFDELNRTQTPLTQLSSSLVSPHVTVMSDAAWRLFLGVRLLDSLLDDPTSSLAQDGQALRLRDKLRHAGLASDDYPDVLRKVRSRRSGFGPAWLSGEFTSTDSDMLSPSQLGEAVLKLVLSARTDNRHLLMIDGLDKAITQNDSYWLTIAALIRVADFIRASAKQADSSVYLVVLCRSDAFRNISFADAPKIAADGGVHISWHAEAQRPEDVLLWESLALKAKLSKQDLWAYLPPRVLVGKEKSKAIPRLTFLLERTRYTPRDLNLLFRQFQQATREGPLNSEAVRRASDQFVTNHLVNEMTSEAFGLLPDVVAKRLSSFLSTLPSRVVTPVHMFDGMREHGLEDEISLRDLGEYLFLQGAVGNYNEASGYVQFFHRRDVSQFKQRGPWVLHTGIVQAMNIPWARV